MKLAKSSKTIDLILDILSSPNGYGILAVQSTLLDKYFEFCRKPLYFNKDFK